MLKSHRAWLVAGVSCLLLVGVWLICSLPQRQRNRDPDGQLVDRVFQAVDRQLPPDRAESFVGKWRTSERRERRNWPCCTAGSALAGFARPSTGFGRPRLIGILWTDTGQARVFFGVVLPPG
jgi:hypothetical protein